jgi:hypothetical protein
LTKFGDWSEGDIVPVHRTPDVYADRQQLGKNRIRPIALGRQDWLFAGSLRAGPPKHHAVLGDAVAARVCDPPSGPALEQGLIDVPPAFPAERLNVRVAHGISARYAHRDRSGSPFSRIAISSRPHCIAHSERVSVFAVREVRPEGLQDCASGT